MNHSYRIQYKRVLLRPLKEQDIEELRVLRNKNRAFFVDSRYISPDQQKTWFQQYLEKENDVMFAVELTDHPDEFIGAIALYNMRPQTKTMEFGRTLIDKEKAPEKNIGTEAVIAVCRAAFENLKAETVTAEVLKGNEQACRAYAKAGFIIVGEDEKSWRLALKSDKLRKVL